MLIDEMLEGREICEGTQTMFKAVLLGVALVAVMATTATAQVYYPYSYPGYGYYSYPGYSYPTYGYPSYGYSYGYFPSYRWADPYSAWRPYSSAAVPKASTRGGY